MTPRPPRGLWEWTRALLELAPTDGARATGMAWASYCWSWRQGDTEERVLDAHPPMLLERFGEAHRPGVALRTLRRHFRELQAAGLLELHQARSRWSPNVYVPRVPEQRPQVASVEGEQRPQVASVEGEQRPQVAPTPATGGQTPSYRDLPETPLASGRVHDADARTRVETGEGGRLGLNKTGESQVLEQIVGRMPPDVSRRLTEGWRRTCLVDVRQLLERGWLPNALAQAVNEDTWFGARKVGPVLRSRLQELLTEPPREGAAEAPPAAWPEKCGGCDERRQVELPDGSIARCPTCHPLAHAAAFVAVAL